MNDKPKRRSRWVKGSGIDRWDAKNKDVKYPRQEPGWRNGARVRPK